MGMGFVDGTSGEHLFIHTDSTILYHPFMEKGAKVLLGDTENEQNKFELFLQSLVTLKEENRQKEVSVALFAHQINC